MSIAKDSMRGATGGQCWRASIEYFGLEKEEGEEEEECEGQTSCVCRYVCVGR